MDLHPMPTIGNIREHLLNDHHLDEAAIEGYDAGAPHLLALHDQFHARMTRGHRHGDE